ncbi:MAG: sialate O-acetylesterase, partial [Phycisphaera sp.]|nr:sialate O-acetylesterase [Phycisphaera sp.]
MAASTTPRELRITGENEIRINDVLVGEVWICGGQSNMEWTVDESEDPDRERADADRPTLRVINAPRVTSNAMRDDIVAEWIICTPETVGGFTAVGYAFGRELQDALDVPVGLLSINWGGTRIEPWISTRSLLASELSRDRMRDMVAEREAFESMSEAERFDRDQLRRNEHAREIATYLDRQQQKDPGTRG